MTNTEKAIYSEVLPVDPSYRAVTGDLEDMTYDNLVKILNYKGYRVNRNEMISRDSLIRAIREVEEKGSIDILGVPPLKSDHYVVLNEMWALRDAGYRVADVNDDYTYIVDAHECFQKGIQIPTSNPLHNMLKARIFEEREKNKKDKPNKETSIIPKEELDVEEYYALAGFKDETQFSKALAIYHDAVIQNLPYETIRQKYDIRLKDISSYINKAREYASIRFLPQDEIADKLIEVRALKSGLAKELIKAKERLAEFDDKTDNAYYTFIEAISTEEGDGRDKVIIKGIARERKSLLDGVSQITKELRDFIKLETELQGNISSTISLININNPSSGGGRVSGSGQPNAPEVDYYDYITYLSSEDQVMFNKILDKLADLYFKEKDGVSLVPRPTSSTGSVIVEAEYSDTTKGNP
jgi:hypothetical protein